MILQVRVWHHDGEIGEGLAHGRFGDLMPVDDQYIASARVLLAVDPMDESIGLVGPEFDASEELKQQFSMDLRLRERLAMVRQQFTGKKQDAAAGSIPVLGILKGICWSEWVVLGVMLGLALVVSLKGR